MENQCPQCGRKIYFEGLCLKCREENKQKEILALDESGLTEKIAEVTKDGFDEKLCLLLIRLRGINTEKLAEEAWKKRELTLPAVYNDASEELTSEMITELFRDDLESRTANKLLICLAHKGGKAVEDAFRELEKHPKKWRKKLHVDPSYYANYGGWTFDDKGTITKTVFDKCFPLVKSTPEKAAKSPVRIVTAADGICPECGSKYINIIELDGREKNLEFLGIEGEIAVKCCPNCIPYMDDNFCRFDLNGNSEPIPAESDALPADEPDWADELTENTFALAEEPAPVYFPCGWDTGSAVGGFPFWIQDCIIKSCPDCGKPMMVLAQIGEEPLGYEGNIYVEICRDCKVAAVLYQQT